MGERGNVKIVSEFQIFCPGLSEIFRDRKIAFTAQNGSICDGINLRILPHTGQYAIVCGMDMEKICDSMLIASGPLIFVRMRTSHTISMHYAYATDI